MSSIAIIGAGFAGLSAAWELSQAGYKVTVYEGSDRAGGLAAGFQEPDWEWSLEKHYHHIFESDSDVKNFIEDVGLSDTFFFKKVATKTRYQGTHFQLDSALSLITCPILSPVAKFRMAKTLAHLKSTDYQPWMEDITAKEYLIKEMGSESWEKIWEPLFEGKFGSLTTKVNAAWFWARIHVRSAKLGYFAGGFGQLANGLVVRLEEKGVTFHFSSPVVNVEQVKKGFAVTTIAHNPRQKNTPTTFDQVLVAAPAPVLLKLFPHLPATYQQQLTALESLGALTLILELDQPFFSDQTYWLNINEKGWPFLAVVEHTNFVSKKHYNNHSLVYVGKYLHTADPQFGLAEDQLLKKYHPYLAKLSSSYHNHIVNSWVFREAFAQPIVPVRHAQNVPAIETPIDGLYWASMQHVYPWDRGTNYAVQIGKQAAQKILQK